MSFALTAVNCPTPTSYAAARSVTAVTSMANNAPGWPQLPYAGAPKTISIPFNQLATLAANAMIFGGSGYDGLITGLTLSTGAGLALAVAAGQALIGTLTEYAGGAVTVPDNTARVFVWLSQGGTLSVTTTKTAPSGTQLYIGNCVTVAGAVTAVDYSGVVYRNGALPFRSTNDFGPPADNPGPLGMLTFSTDSEYLWDGSVHKRIVGEKLSAITLSSTTVTLTAAQCNATFLEFSGTPGGATAITLPLVAGRSYQILNGTAVALTLGGVTGTTVVVAAGKAAILVSDGTNWVRLTPDT